MPEEIVFIVIFSIVAGVTAMIAVTKIIVGYLERRHQGPSDSSLTQTELKELIASAVADATNPIERQLETLQRQIGPAEDRAMLPEPGPEERDTQR